MNTGSLIVMLAAFASGAFAQNLAPDLAPLAAKYKSETAALDAQRAAALKQAQQPYIAALDSAEKNATTAGNVAAVAAIATERGGLGKELLAPSPPAGLPKELQAPRKTCLDAIARARAADAPRRQTLDAAYLRALAGLSAKAAKDPDLAKQIETEKQNLLAAAPAATSIEGGRTNAKNAVVNGSFDVVDAQGHPGGWITPEGFTVVRDGANNVLHGMAKAPGYVAVTQDIVLPARAKSVTLRGRVRGKFVGRDPAQNHYGACIAAVFIDKQDQGTNNWLMLDGGRDPKWTKLTVTQPVPNNMKALQVVLVLKYVVGEFDYDDIEVEFR
jgi:hypothetical protein